MHEALLGRRTATIARFLDASQWWPPAALRELQLRKLRRLVEHARRNSPYYQAIGLPSPEHLRSLADLERLPLLDRDALRDAAWQMRWRKPAGRTLACHTHGTTDDAFVFFWDRNRQAWDKANRTRAHAWHGLYSGEPELHVWPLDPPKSAAGRLRQRLRELRDELFNEMQIDSLGAFREHLPMTWQAWRRFDPACVTAYPSVLAELIDQGRSVGCRLPSGRLRRIFLTGEVTFDWQRTLIERSLGAPTSQDYGMQEAGALAYECPHGRWHVSAESVIIEILRDGRSAAPGEYGEIVVTGLESFAMPIIRYCTGDIVQVPEPTPTASCGPVGRGPVPECPCGRGLPILPPVRGRASDFLQAADGTWIAPAAVIASVGQALDHESFQIGQEADGQIVLRVLAADGDAARGWTRVASHLGRLLGPSRPWRVEYVGALERSASGKRRVIASRRTAAGLASRDGSVGSVRPAPAADAERAYVTPWASFRTRCHDYDIRRPNSEARGRPSEGLERVAAR